MRRRIAPIALTAVLLTLAGCLTSGTLDEKGGGTLTLKVRLSSPAQLQSRKIRLQSRAVKVTRATIDEDNWATFDLEFDDVTKLSTVQHFQNTTITLTDGPDGTKVLTVKSANPNPHQLSDEVISYFGKDMTIAMTLPGPIVKTNATSTKDRTATWTYALRDFVAAKEEVMEVTFKAPPTKDGAGAN
jgi:LppM domain